MSSDTQSKIIGLRNISESVIGAFFSSTHVLSILKAFFSGLFPIRRQITNRWKLAETKSSRIDISFSVDQDAQTANEGWETKLHRDSISETVGENQQLNQDIDFHYMIPKGCSWC